MSRRLCLTKVLPKHRHAPRHHAVLPYHAVPAFLRTRQAAEASEASRLAFEFLILTAARTSEVLLATWSEVDLDTRTWTIPGARMKSGRAHSVPLAPRVLEILHRAKGLSDGGPYVFPGRARTKPLWNMVLLILLRRLQRDHLTVHGFRSTFRDWAAERTNVPRAICEAVLAHTLRDKAEASPFQSRNEPEADR